MDSRTRVEAALGLDVPDRPPIGAWGHSYLKEWSAKDLAAATIDAQRQFHWDFVKFQPRASCFAEAFGIDYKPSGNAHRRPIRLSAQMKGARDWSKIELKDLSPLTDQVESIGIVANALGPRVPVMQTVFSPMTVAAHILGGEPKTLLDHARNVPELFSSALERISLALIDFSRNSIEAGAAGIFFAISGYASDDFISEPNYDELFLKHDLAVTGSFPSAAWFNVLHLCDSHIHFSLGSKLPVHAISWASSARGNPSLAEGVKRSGKAAMGGISQRTTLLRGPKSSIAEQVRRAAKANNGHGILIAPGCSVPPKVPAENLAAMGEAVRAGS